MRRYVSCTKQSSDSFGRYATAQKTKEILSKSSELAEFQDGYKKGSLKYAIASKYMNLKYCGMDRYLEKDQNTVWALNDNTICRLDIDLSWIDELEKGN
jgi:hypothetical protein